MTDTFEEYFNETAVFETLPDFLWQELEAGCAVCGGHEAVFQFGVGSIGWENPTTEVTRPGRTFCCTDCACKMLRDIR